MLEEKDPSPGVVAQVLSKEGAEKEEEEDTGQDDIMPGSFEPAHREPSLPWTEVVRKNLDDFLTFLHVKSTLSLLLYRLLKDSIIGDWDILMKKNVPYHARCYRL